MRTSLLVLFFFASAGCYDTFTRDDLHSLGSQPIVLWAGDGQHYHLGDWSLDSAGNVQATGLTCASTSATFDHPPVNAAEFTGTIQKWSIARVRTATVQTNDEVVLLVLGAAAAGVLLALIAFSGVRL